MGFLTSLLGTEKFLTGRQKTATWVLDCTEQDFELKSTKIFLLSTVTVRVFFWYRSKIHSLRFLNLRSFLTKLRPLVKMR